MPDTTPPDSSEADGEERCAALLSDLKRHIRSDLGKPPL